MVTSVGRDCVGGQGICTLVSRYHSLLPISWSERESSVVFTLQPGRCVKGCYLYSSSWFSHLAQKGDHWVSGLLGVI